ncbi:Hypothetical protein NTJ_02320 [Nesidiocoris tenuis]|uniref:Uncharacterized protein n=1 Tax=Nesidiocoris tenuis TaxID=355587 RepID=A0ABN7ABW8_9HEMI|nr:Hypothetical protein NTJ_02320 [Nesidiocoris tenuis]
MVPRVLYRDVTTQLREPFVDSETRTIKKLGFREEDVKKLPGKRKVSRRIFQRRSYGETRLPRGRMNLLFQEFRSFPLFAYPTTVSRIQSTQARKTKNSWK